MPRGLPALATRRYERVRGRIARAMVDITRSRLRLESRGIELQLLDWGGTGPLALLSHANGFCAAVWDGVARRLRERFHVVAFDARGHGASSKPPEAASYAWEMFALDLLELATELPARLGQDRIALAVGHSFGGTVTLDAATRRPEHFEKIAMLDPVLIPQDAGDVGEGGRRLGHMARVRRHEWPSREAVLRSWKTRDLFRGWEPRLLELYVHDGTTLRADGSVELACPGEVEAAVFECTDRIDPFAAAQKLEQPGLLVRAAEGQFPRSFYEQISQTAPNLRLVELPAGHLLPMVLPDRTGELLLEFSESG